MASMVGSEKFSTNADSISETENSGKEVCKNSMNVGV